MISINLSRLLAQLRRRGIAPSRVIVYLDDGVVETRFQRPQPQSYGHTIDDEEDEPLDEYDGMYEE